MLPETLLWYGRCRHAMRRLLHTRIRERILTVNGLCSPQMRGVIRREIEGGGHAEETVEIVFPGKHRIPVNVDTDILRTAQVLGQVSRFSIGGTKVSRSCVLLCVVRA